MQPVCPPGTHLRRVSCLALLVGFLAAGLATAHAAPPSLQPLLRGKWPVWAKGNATDVKVEGNYARVTLGFGGLSVIDESNPAHCVQVGSYDTSGYALGVAVSGNHAYVADLNCGASKSKFLSAVTHTGSQVQMTAALGVRQKVDNHHGHK